MTAKQFSREGSGAILADGVEVSRCQFKWEPRLGVPGRSNHIKLAMEQEIPAEFFIRSVKWEIVSDGGDHTAILTPHGDDGLNLSATSREEVLVRG